MKNNLENSEALKRVWEWKQEIYKDVKNLSLNDKLKKIHEMAVKSKKELKLIK